MQINFLRLRVVSFVTGFVLLASSGLASADPPSRVARMGYLSGNVSYSPAGENDWIRASINRPLTTGDRLWVDSRARAEIQIGGAMVRMNSETSVTILNLDDRIAQLRLSQGTLNVRVRRLARNQVFEVNTPNLAFTLLQPGEYRITVDPDGYATDIFVRRGQGEAYGDGAAYVIDSRQGYSFTGTGLRDYEYINAPRFDDFDRWSSDRDHRYDNSPSARYVSQDVVGYEDLDANGNWRVDATYGSVWFPNRVSAGWAPYRDGHWAWVDPWGWTWVDDAPWGFAVSHYGRWTNLRGTWGWVPGPVRERAYYAPALVAFVGGNNFQLSFSSGSARAVAWFPLAPREIYQPSYTVSRGYFENINRSNTIINSTVINNTIINNTVINNTYNNSNVTNIVYANQSVPGAVIAVPTTAFVQSRPVAQAAVQVPQAIIASAPVASVPRIAPSAQSVRGGAVQSSAPPASMFDRPVVARSAPPAPPASFAVQQQQLTGRQGSPLDDAARRDLRPAMAAPAPVVRVVAPAQIAQPTAPPPPSAGPGRVNDGRDISSDRGAPTASGNPRPPGAVPQFAPPAPVAPSQPQSGRPEQRDRGEQRAQPFSPPPMQGAAPAPAAPSQPQSGRPEQRERSDQRVQPFSPPPMQGAAPAPVPSPQMAPTAPAIQPPSPEQRGRQEQRGQSEQRPPQFAPRQPTPAPAPAASPQISPQPPAVPPQEERGRAEQRGRGEPQRVAPPAPVAAPQLVPQAPALPPSGQRERLELRDKNEPPGKPLVMPPQPPPGAAQVGKDNESVENKQKRKKKEEEQKREDEARK